ncbi:hypothetical protein [Sinanaerobacter chloroacetimidivorans]|uniref:hypothetical protein n=1 Tax=Sinanaerobacter chloroacetimidivorans TaxID=2818044 RepID=UPI001D04D504|nr:hypothetical protein [Sinanaerobacter chloroacetimidivorans]
MAKRQRSKGNSWQAKLAALSVLPVQLKLWQKGNVLKAIKKLRPKSRSSVFTAVKSLTNCPLV